MPEIYCDPFIIKKYLENLEQNSPNFYLIHPINALIVIITRTPIQHCGATAFFKLFKNSDLRTSEQKHLQNQALARNSQWGGLFWGSGGFAPSRRRLGVWGLCPQPPEARGSGGGAPSAQKFCIFFAKIT